MMMSTSPRSPSSPRTPTGTGAGQSSKKNGLSAKFKSQVLAGMIGAVLCYVLFVFRMESSCTGPPSTTTFKGGTSRAVVMQKKQSSSSSSSPSGTASLEDAINSATGTLFEGKKFRTFTEGRFFPGISSSSSSSSKQRQQVPTTTTDKQTDSHIMLCDKWNVVTTIFAPSEAVIRAAKVSGWCTVIIADTKTPLDYMVVAGLVGMESTVHYLSVADQQEWLRTESSSSTSKLKKSNGGMTAVGQFLNVIPFKHFARKNIGYLYAIQHGAKIIFDFDDDNLLPIDPKSGNVYPPLSNDKQLVDSRIVMTGPIAFNHHPLMGASVQNSWARGFPLQYVQDKPTQGQIAYNDVTLDLMESVGVMQFCANGNPDIDAIHRLVHPLPMTFARRDGTDGTTVPVETSPVSTKGSIIVPSHTFAPYNAQATIHTYKALWALLLPFTVPGRVSDIWRGYFAEALFRDLGLSVAFLPPAIVQDRNEHSYLADMQAELDLYFKGGALLEFLSGWDSPSETIPQRMEELWIDLYERGYIDLNDVKVVQLWLAALLEVGYVFPPMVRRRVDHTVLMGQFNFAVPANRVIFWHQKWRQWFNRLVVRGPFDSTQIAELQRHGIDAYTAFDDKGYYTPMTNLAATLQDVKDIDGVTGVLYAHDDMLLNVTNLFQNIPYGTTTGSHYLMATLRVHPTDPNFRSYSIQADGTLFLKEDGPLDKATLLRRLDWPHTEKCLDPFWELRADPRSKELSVLDKDGSVHIPAHGWSDIMYVPTTLADEYSNLAQLMVDYKVFLECGFPKIVEVLYRRSNKNVQIEIVKQCTKVADTGLRGGFKMLQACDIPNSAYHPVKLSMGFADWDVAFEWATTSNESFVFE